MSIFGKKQIITFILCASLFVLALSPVRSAASALTLAWDPNTEDDLAGYNVYYGTQTGDYDFVIDVGDTTQYTVTDLDPETQYYFTVTAYDTSSNESDFSAEVSAVTDPPHYVISGLGETSSGYIEAFGEDYSHADWLRVGWKSYNSANGEARIATGDIDGDGRDEIVVGLGPVWEQPYPSGYFEVFDDDFTHLTWCRIQWKTYNNTNGESRPACGDVDGDGYDEIIIGLGSGGKGYFEIFDYDADSITHKDWGRVNWKSYNNTNGESRPSCGDVDGDGYDEIIIGLGRGGSGYFEIFDYDADSITHKDWGRVNWKSYNKSYGKTRAACGNVDGDVYDEIIIGLGWGGKGYFEIFDYDADSITHKDWGVVQWTEYNIGNGETRPACGDIDGDGLDEIVIGLGEGADGYLEIFDDAVAGCGHVAWPRVHWKSYNSTNGETWPALKK
jgi:hypothetical protein